MAIPLLLGVFSSWHCLAMCGPLFSVLLFTNSNSANSWINFLIYQFSRVFVYGLIGFIPILFGLTYISFQVQQIISIVCGVIILFFTWFTYFKNTKVNQSISNLIKKINSIGIKVNNSTRYIFLGVANGLLPCGMVYIALVASIGNIPNLHPSIFMMIFGLATIPVFLGLFLIRKTIVGNNLLKSIFKAKTLFLTAVAILLILRGLNLNIPLISPAMNGEGNSTSISCCHDPKKQSD